MTINQDKLQERLGKKEKVHVSIPCYIDQDYKISRIRGLLAVTDKKILFYYVAENQEDKITEYEYKNVEKIRMVGQFLDRRIEFTYQKKKVIFKQLLGSEEGVFYQTLTEKYEKSKSKEK